MLELLCEQLSWTWQQSGVDWGGEERHGRARIRNGISTFHLRLPGSPQETWGKDCGVFRYRRHNIICSMLWRQRWSIRAIVRTGGRHHLWLIEPCFYHRWSTSLQGTAFPLCQRRHGRPWETVTRRSEMPFPPYRHRRCLLYGRQRMSSWQDLWVSSEIRCNGDGWREPFSRCCRTDRTWRHRTLQPTWKNRDTHRNTWQGIRRRHGRIHNR